MPPLRRRSAVRRCAPLQRHRAAPGPNAPASPAGRHRALPPPRAPLPAGRGPPVRRGVALSPRTVLFPTRGHPATARPRSSGVGGEGETRGALRCAPRWGRASTARGHWDARGSAARMPPKPAGTFPRFPTSCPVTPPAPRHGPGPPRAEDVTCPRAQVPGERCRTHVSPRAPTPARPRATPCPRGAVPGSFPRPAVLRGRVWPCPGGRGAARCRAAVPRAGAQRCAAHGDILSSAVYLTAPLPGKAGGGGSVLLLPPLIPKADCWGAGGAAPPPSPPSPCCSPPSPLHSCCVPTGPRSPCLAVCHRGHSVPQFPHLQG